MKKRRNLAATAALGGLFAALFFVSSNLIPPVHIIPGVPLTFQVLVIALMTLTLGMGASFAVLLTICVMTLAGVPMMSGFMAGPAVFAGPTGGYIAGWFFLILLLGAARRLFEKRAGPKWARPVLTVIAGGLGMVLCYAAGAAWLTVYNAASFSSFLSVWFASIGAFLGLDCCKVALAYLLARAVRRAFLPRLYSRS